MNPRFREIAGALSAPGWQLYFDVSPLFEEHWTGIPAVAAGLARALLDTLPEHVHFFYEHHLVACAAIEEALARRSGLYLLRDFFDGPAQAGKLPALAARTRAIGLYPSVKRVSQIFPIECSIYHDLSTLITPRFHLLENIRHHQKGLVDDLRTNDLTFGVSQATVDDLKAYLGAPEDRVFVAHNGVSWPWWYPIEAYNAPTPGREDPYFLVLGTREPRKNLARVFELLALFPELLATSRFVIAGRIGWLGEQERMPQVLEQAMATGRLMLPGYVSDFEKYVLLQDAIATIYPSFFEGFGLPVLESLSLATPVIASFSSAVPEIGGDACFYFDPFSVESLYRTLRRVLDEAPKQNPAYRACCHEICARFTWENMLLAILDPLIARLAETGAPARARLRAVR